MKAFVYSNLIALLTLACASCSLTTRFGVTQPTLEVVSEDNVKTVEGRKFVSRRFKVRESPEEYFIENIELPTAKVQPPKEIHETSAQ